MEPFSSWSLLCSSRAWSRPRLRAPTRHPPHQALPRIRYRARPSRRARPPRRRPPPRRRRRRSGPHHRPPHPPRRQRPPQPQSRKPRVQPRRARPQPLAPAATAARSRRPPTRAPRPSTSPAHRRSPRQPQRSTPQPPEPQPSRSSSPPPAPSPSSPPSAEGWCDETSDPHRRPALAALRAGVGAAAASNRDRAVVLAGAGHAATGWYKEPVDDRLDWSMPRHSGDRRMRRPYGELRRRRDRHGRAGAKRRTGVETSLPVNVQRRHDAARCDRRVAESWPRHQRVVSKPAAGGVRRLGRDCRACSGCSSGTYSGPDAATAQVIGRCWDRAEQRQRARDLRPSLRRACAVARPGRRLGP